MKPKSIQGVCSLCSKKKKTKLFEIKIDYKKVYTGKLCSSCAKAFIDLSKEF